MVVYTLISNWFKAILKNKFCIKIGMCGFFNQNPVTKFFSWNKQYRLFVPQRKNIMELFIINYGKEQIFCVANKCSQCNCSWLVVGIRFSPGTLVSSINKTDRHDITEILLNVVLTIINLTYILMHNTNTPLQNCLQL